MSTGSVRTRVYIFVAVIALIGAADYFTAPYWSDSGGAALASSGDASGDGPQADEKGKEGEEEEDIVPVQLVTAEAGAISSYLSATANLRALREVEVVSQTEGLLMQLSAEEGDFVREGQVLCRLDDSQLQIRLRSARQKLAQAELQQEKARIRGEKAAVQIRNTNDELERYEQLYAESLVSEREVAQLRYRLDELEHDERVSSHETRELAFRVDELQAEIEQVQLEIDRTLVRAPFSGRITQRHVEKGQTVRQLDQLFRLGSFSTLYADVFLSERDAALVRSGQNVRVALGSDGETAAVGTVARISPVVDQETGTVKVTVQLAGDARDFKPGAFVRVHVETDSRSGNVLIPKRAVLEEDGQSYVFVVREGVATRKQVQLGYQTEGRAEVLQGLAGGEQVVTAGQGALKDGSKVKVVEG